MLMIAAALAGAAAAPSFDCRKAATLVEQTICASPEIAGLDARVAAAFAAVQNQAAWASQDAELMEQRLWLRRRAERCPATPALRACLSNLYRTRLEDLTAAAKVQARGTGDSSASTPPMPDTSAADLEACRAVADTVERNSRSRPKSSPFLQMASWRKGSLDVGLGTDDEGTMHDGSPVVASRGVSKFLNREFSKPDGSEPWSMTIRWFFHAGRPYVVRYPDWSDIYPEYVGALNDDLTERPLCRLAVKVDVRLAPARPADEGVCRAVWAGGGQTLNPSRTGPMPKPPGQDAPGGPQIEGMVLVDAMNDGHPIHMYLYAEDWTQGAGCQVRYYDTAPIGTRSSAHTSWYVAQGLLRDAASARRCADADPVWKRVAGRTYLVSQSERARKPTYDQDEFMTVDTVFNGAPRRVCRGDFSRRRVTITDIWRGGGWRPLRR